MVNGFLSGRPQAVDALVEANYARVFSLGLSLLKDRDEAKDVAQDTFIRVFEKVGQFRYRSSLKTWILSIAYNLCINRLNCTSKNLWTDIEGLPDVAEGMEEDDERFIEEQKFEYVEKALSSMETSDKLLISLFYLDECSIKEIALILQKSETSVKTGLFRARRKLKEMVIKQMNYEFN